MLKIYRSLTGLLIAGIMLLSHFSTAASQEGTRLVISSDTQTATACEPVEITVRVEDVEDLTAYSLKVIYAADRLEILSVENGGFLDDGIIEPTNDWESEPGVIYFGMAQVNSVENPLQPKDGSGDLIRIQAVALVEGETISIEVDAENSYLVNWPQVMPIEFTAVAGELETGPCEAINLSSRSIDENLPAGSEVGAFSMAVEPLAEAYTYTLVDTELFPDSQFFRIEGDRLLSDASFNYEVKDEYQIKVRSEDGEGHNYEREFTIQVNDVNDPPVIHKFGDISASEGVQLVLNFTAEDEDREPEPDELTFSLQGDVPEGASITSGGRFTWTPTEEQGPGEYTFSVCVSDGQASDCAEITITVNEVNNAPVATPQSIKTVEDTPKAITLMASDPEGDPLTYIIVDQPEHGMLRGSANNRVWVYTPDENYYGPDSFTFKVNDGQLDSAPATVTITVDPVNDPPVGAPDAYSLESGKVLTVNAPGVLANDSDVDGDTLTAVLAQGPAHGKLQLNADGSFTYTPNAGFAGTDSFQYRASDGTAQSELVKVTLTVTKTWFMIRLPIVRK